MRKIFLAFLVLSGIASATEVTLCQFKNGIGYANSKVICEEKSYSTIQDMYADGWRYKGTFEIKDEAYLVMEKENSK
ncbi:MAG: hypothetical protein AB7S49_13145 [Arcobacter sp.]|uniref:hypothetical protein n=1 Tax=Arcobacter sp. TaxID=1872629 RepID=UPI003CFD97C2